jgi:tetratricopeptide (TPR) repeat protein
VAWLIVALAGSERQAEPEPLPDLPADHPDAIDPPVKAVKWKKAWGVPGAFGAVAIVMLVSYALPVSRQQSWLRAAAVSLRTGDWPTSLEQLDRALGAISRDPQPYLHKARILAEWAEHEARSGRIEEARKLFGLSVGTIEEASGIKTAGAELARLHAAIEQRAADVLNETYRYATAVSQLRKAIQSAPTSIQDHLQLADLLWKLKQTEQAGQVYYRALELDAQLYLDPVRQLTPAERGVVTQRIRAAGMEPPASQPARRGRPDPSDDEEY